MINVYIHGNGATSNSFTYIRQMIGGKDILINYDSEDGFFRNLEKMKDLIDQTTEPLTFIAHSLGGIYALHLYEIFSERTVRGITLSTPYGGSEHATVLQWFMPFSKVLKDIALGSEPNIVADSIKLEKPWVNIVTTIGSKLIHKPNDGVVSVASQRYRSDMKLIEVPLNHFEVLLSKDVVDIIKSEMSENQKAKKAR